MTQVTVPWGQEEISFDLPPNWNVEAVLKPPGLDKAADPAEAAARAIANPTGSPPLSELAGKAKRVVIAVDDSSRPNPAFLILPTVLKVLHDAGRKTEDITIRGTRFENTAAQHQKTGLRIGRDVGRVMLQDNTFRNCPGHLQDLRPGGKP